MQVTLAQLAQIIGGRFFGTEELARSIVGRHATSPSALPADGVWWNVADARWPRGGTSPLAIVSISEPAVTNSETSPAWIVVPDVSAALRVFAGWKRKRYTGQVVAVSGPIGKSTTRRMIAHLATARFPSQAIATHVPELGCVGELELTLANLANEPACVLECNSATDVRLCDPQVAVLTSRAGSDGFSRRDGTVLELLEALQPQATAIVPAAAHVDDDVRVEVPRIITYGREADSDVALRHVRSSGGQLSFSIARTPFEIPIWGRHHALATAATIAVGIAWRIPILEIVTNLRKLPSHVSGCQVFHHANMTLINDTRHGGPESLRAALELLREINASTSSESCGRKIVVCESLPDLSNVADAYRELGEQVITIAGADMLLAIGDAAAEMVQAARESGMPATSATCLGALDSQRNQANTRTTNQPRSTRAAAALTTDLLAILRPGDTVLLKGWPGGVLEQIANEITEENTSLPWGSLEGLPTGSIHPAASAF